MDLAGLYEQAQELLDKKSQTAIEVLNRIGEDSRTLARHCEDQFRNNAHQFPWCLRCVVHA